jgi:hypothetical protein
MSEHKPLQGQFTACLTNMAGELTKSLVRSREHPKRCLSKRSCERIDSSRAVSIELQTVLRLLT